jgi:small multidrug resistance pump
MSAYLSLLGAIIFEVAGTLMLPLTKEFSEKLPTFIMSICYFASFYFLTLALRAIPLAIVYACWSGLGVLSIAVLSYFIYGQGIKLASYFRIILNSKWSNSC